MAVFPYRFSHLTSLALTHAPFGKKGASALFYALQKGVCPSLQKVSLGHTYVQDEGLMTFATALEDGMPCSNSLTMIDFQCCNIGMRGGKALFHAMTEKGALPNIKELRLLDNGAFEVEGVAESLSALERGAGKKVKIIDLSGMKMTDVEARLIGKAFATKMAFPATLKRFRIDYSSWTHWKLTDEGRKAIKNGLEDGG